MQALNTHSTRVRAAHVPALGEACRDDGRNPLTLWLRGGEEGRGRGKDSSELSIVGAPAFPWSLHFPDWTRRSSLRAAGCRDKPSGRRGCHSTEKDRGGQHPRPLPRNQDAIPAALGQEVLARRGAHTWTRLSCRSSPSPAPAALGGRCRGRVDRPTLAQRFLV